MHACVTIPISTQAVLAWPSSNKGGGGMSRRMSNCVGTVWYVELKLKSYDSDRMTVCGNASLKSWHKEKMGSWWDMKLDNSNL